MKDWLLKNMKFKLRNLSLIVLIFMVSALLFSNNVMADENYQIISLKGLANRSVYSYTFGDTSGDIKDFPVGSETINRIPFKFEDKIIVLNGGLLPNGPTKVTIPINNFAEELNFVHASGFTTDNSSIGQYKINYADGTSETIDIKPLVNIEEISGDHSYAPQVELAFIVEVNEDVAHFGLFKYKTLKPYIKINSIDFIDSGTYPQPILAGLTIKVAQPDTTPPVITINMPQDGAVYNLNQQVQVNWTATDDLSGIDTATGTVANGEYLDTSTSGDKTFTVFAKDKAGNQATKTVHYHVNTPPVVSTNKLTISGVLRDAENDSITLTASVGTVTNNGDSTWTWSCDNVGTLATGQIVTITADDGQGGVTTYRFTLSYVVN